MARYGSRTWAPGGQLIMSVRYLSRTQVGIDGTGRALATAARVGCDSARRGVTLRVELDLSRRVSRLSSHYHPILTP